MKMVIQPFLGETLSIGMVGMFPKKSKTPPHLPPLQELLSALASCSGKSKASGSCRKASFWARQRCVFFRKRVLMFRMLMQKLLQKIFEACLIDMEI